MGADTDYRGACIFNEDISPNPGRLSPSVTDCRSEHTRQEQPQRMARQAQLRSGCVRGGWRKGRADFFLRCPSPFRQSRIISECIMELSMGHTKVSTPVPGLPALGGRSSCWETQRWAAHSSTQQQHALSVILQVIFMLRWLHQQLYIPTSSSPHPTTRKAGGPGPCRSGASAVLAVLRAFFPCWGGCRASVAVLLAPGSA